MPLREYEITKPDGTQVKGLALETRDAEPYSTWPAMETHPELAGCPCRRVVSPFVARERVNGARPEDLAERQSATNWYDQEMRRREVEHNGG